MKNKKDLKVNLKDGDILGNSALLSDNVIMFYIDVNNLSHEENPYIYLHFHEIEELLVALKKYRLNSLLKG